MVREVRAQLARVAREERLTEFRQELRGELALGSLYLETMHGQF